MSEWSWQSIFMNFITGFSTFTQCEMTFNVTLIMTDIFFKIVLYIPCFKNITAEQLADLLWEKAFFFLRLLHVMITDQSSLFTSKFWSTTCYILGIKHKLLTAFHPQTDGQTECQNQTLEHYLHCFINYHQDDWVRWLPMAQYVYNSSVHSSTGQVPMEVLTGICPELQINVEPAPEAHAHSTLERGDAMQKIRAELQTCLQEA